MVGKKCIRHYAADRVLEMPVIMSCCAYNCTETLCELCEGWTHKVLQVSSWARMPAAVHCKTQIVVIANYLIITVAWLWWFKLVLH